MKLCSACEELKEESEFGIKNKKKGTLQSRCRECQREYGRAHYHKNKAKYRKRTKERRKKYKMEKKEYIAQLLKNSRCSICGYDDIRALQFDHIDPALKKYNISDMISGKYHWVSPRAMKEELEKCVIMCANCHAIKTSEQYGFWKEGYLDVA